MKKTFYLIILSIQIVQAGRPIKEVNEKAVTELINTLLSKQVITDTWKERLLQSVISFDHRVPFIYKRINYEGSPLFAALLTKDYRFLTDILNRGASVDYPEQDDATPLMQAAYLGDKKAFKILLRAGANVLIKDKYKWKVHDHALSCPLKNQNPVLKYFKDPHSFLMESDSEEEPEEEFNSSNAIVLFYNPLFNPEI